MLVLLLVLVLEIGLVFELVPLLGIMLELVLEL